MNNNNLVKKLLDSSITSYYFNYFTKGISINGLIFDSFLT